MKSISEDSAKAFLSCTEFKRNNTEVIKTISGCRMLLFGNLIASDIKGVLTIRNAGYPTKTTKRRLDEILSQLGNPGYILTEGSTWFYRSKDRLGNINEQSFQTGSVRIK